MEHWKKIVVFILMLAMPISTWASVTMISHCQTSDSSSHSMHAQMDKEQQMHINHQVAADEVDNSADCECGCSGVLDCSVSGCNATTLLGDCEIKFRALTQTIGQSVKSFLPSPDPHLLFRPPIFLS